jgi:peptidoglycan/LPS O-acetylase OafA/YrhL
MTQGDLTTLTLAHWQIALATGFGVGALSVVLSFGKLSYIESTRWGIALVALLGTTLADYFNHATHFGGPWTEALVTGVGAATLSLIVSFGKLDSLIGKLETWPKEKQTGDSPTRTNT